MIASKKEVNDGERAKWQKKPNLSEVSIYLQLMKGLFVFEFV